MGRNKRWKGHRSWSYLETGVDYDDYPLEKQVNRVPPYNFGLSKSQEERVERIIENNIIISLHEHLNVFPKGYPVERITVERRRQFKAYEGLAHSGIDVVFDNCVCRTFDNVVNFMGMSLCDYAHQDFVIPAMNVDDVPKGSSSGL